MPKIIPISGNSDSFPTSKSNLLQELQQMLPQADKNYNPQTGKHVAALSRKFSKQMLNEHQLKQYRVLRRSIVRELVERFVTYSYEVFRVPPQKLNEETFLAIMPLVAASDEMSPEMALDILVFSQQLVSLYQKEGYMKDWQLHPGFSPALLSLLLNPFGKGQADEDDGDFLTDEMIDVVEARFFADEFGLNEVQLYLYWLTDSFYFVKTALEIENFETLKSVWLTDFKSSHDIAFYYKFVHALSLWDTLAEEDMLPFDLPKNYKQLMIKDFEACGNGNSLQWPNFPINEDGIVSYHGPAEVFIMTSMDSLFYRNKLITSHSHNRKYSERTAKRYQTVLAEFSDYLNEFDLPEDEIQEMSKVIQTFINEFYKSYLASFSQITGSMVAEAIQNLYLKKVKKLRPLSEVVMAFGVIPEFFAWSTSKGYLKNAAPILKRIQELREAYGMRRFKYEVPKLNPKVKVVEIDPLKEMMQRTKK